MFLLLFYITLLYSYLTRHVHAYIPAQASNDTTNDVNGIPINITDSSTLNYYWNMKSNGVTVSYQLAGQYSTGLSMGALLHFSEVSLSTDPTLTPWIAFVACDANATEYSTSTDIFTMAQELGAIAALLYSKYSNGCVINPEYQDPSQFNRLIDIFTLKKIVDSQTIASAYLEIAPIFQAYNSSLLNSSLVAIDNALNNSISGANGGGQANGSGYMVAVLTSYNATATPSPNGPGDPNGGSGVGYGTSGGPPAKKNTGLAMIILYTITGCVSAMFCVAILSGAVRALRDPARYGMRQDDAEAGVTGAGIGGARVLGRAILDTFPIIKFGAGGNGEAQQPTATKKVVDEENGNGNGKAATAIEMNEFDPYRETNAAAAEQRQRASGDIQPVSTEVTHGIEHEEEIQEQHAPGSTAPSERRVSTARSMSASDVPVPQATDAEPVDPDAIGHDTCPICIVDFEPGDDLRVLPCEGPQKHRFHQKCVDPWLLEMSSSCPLCRNDFQTLEAMVQSDYPPNSSMPGLIATSSGTGTGPRRPALSLGMGLRNPRFSRYLRSAQRRRTERAEQERGQPPVPVPVHTPEPELDQDEIDAQGLGDGQGRRA